MRLWQYEYLKLWFWQYYCVSDLAMSMFRLCCSANGWFEVVWYCDFVTVWTNEKFDCVCLKMCMYNWQTLWLPLCWTLWLKLKITVSLTMRLFDAMCLEVFLRDSLLCKLWQCDLDSYSETEFVSILVLFDFMFQTVCWLYDFWKCVSDRVWFAETVSSFETVSHLVFENVIESLTIWVWVIWPLPWSLSDCLSLGFYDCDAMHMFEIEFELYLESGTFSPNESVPERRIYVWLTLSMWLCVSYSLCIRDTLCLTMCLYHWFIFVLTAVWPWDSLFLAIAMAMAMAMAIAIALAISIAVVRLVTDCLFECVLELVCCNMISGLLRCLILWLRDCVF